jgi:DNA polymerase III alpha subunit
MQNIVPIFKTHGSLSKSILSYEEADKPENRDKITESDPTSIISIAYKYHFDKIVVIEDSFLSFPSLYAGLPKGCQLIYGINFTCCKNALDKSEESLKTEHKISIIMKNSGGYKDLLKIHNLVHTNQDYFYYRTRVDLDILKNNWTENLMLIIPPYDNFIHRNLLSDSICVPDFNSLNPLFTFAQQNLPFDYLLVEAITKYAQANKYELQEVHPVYYYRDEDVKAFYAYKCIENRSTFEEPKMDFMCSNNFSFESYLRKINDKFIQ